MNEVAALQRLTTKQLRERYVEVFGEATWANNRAWLVRRIAWRLQNALFRSLYTLYQRSII